MMILHPQVALQISIPDGCIKRGGSEEESRTPISPLCDIVWPTFSVTEPDPFDSFSPALYATAAAKVIKITSSQPTLRFKLREKKST